MSTLLIKGATVVNEGEQFKADVLLQDDRIFKISDEIIVDSNTKVIDSTGLYLFPGVIDDQVHFREPGLIHKGDIYSESKAAAAGGITTFMEMPNTIPQATNLSLLEDKYSLAEEKSWVNFSFYLGATNDNVDEIKNIDPKRICGVKVFMGSSTGNMLVDNINSLQKIFAESPTIIATHCEDEATIQANTQHYKEKFGENIPFKYHPVIRNVEACYKSSALAIELATKYSSQLHILHLSTQKELSLLSNEKDISKKKITGEVCIHHLWFNDSDYDKYGAKIKWNPAIKSVSDQNALLKGLIDHKLDVVATDHAPHTIEEKSNKYFSAPSGGPLVQHSLVAMLEYYHNNKINLSSIINKMCHNPARLFKIKERGFIREGYKADLVLVNLNKPWTVSAENLQYKCGWSPFEGTQFKSKVITTIVNGNVVFDRGNFFKKKGERIEFER